MKMITKRIIFVLAAFLLLGTLLPTPTPTHADIGDWIIDGDRVYIDDENVYLSATPHTLTGSGWVEFELMSKNYEGGVDAVWGFESGAGVVTKNPQVWADNVPHEMERWVDVERSGEVTFDNVASYETLTVGSTAPDIGNNSNSKLIRVMGERLGIDGMEDYSLVIAYNAVDQHNETSATFYYNYTGREKEYYTEYYTDYRDLNIGNFTSVNYNYLGMDTWKFVNLDFAVTKNTTYKMRVWIDIPFSGLNKFTSKYVWGIKPGNESVQQAKNNGHLYVLDPWLAGGWDQRVKFTVDSGDITDNLTDIPILVYISASSGINSEDVTFVFDELTSDANRKKIAVTTEDEETQVYVEIEKWDDANEQAWLWIKGPSVNSTPDTDFYLYYDSDHADNDAYVGDTNDVVAENVWDANFIMVYHMRDNPDTSNVRDSTSNDNDGVKAAANNPAITTNGMIDGAQSFDANNDKIVTPDLGIFDGSGDFEISMWTDSNSLTNSQILYDFRALGDTAIVGDFGADDEQFRATVYIDGTGWVSLTSNNDFDLDWHHYRYVFRSASGGQLYIDDSSEGTEGTTGTILAEGDENRIGLQIDDTNDFDGEIDEIRISDTDRGTAWRTAVFESDNDDLLDWGVEELEVGPPTVTTQAATDKEDTTATGNGNITSTGGENADRRGIVWDLASQGAPGDVAPGASGYANDVGSDGSFGTGAFTESLTSLPTGDTIYARAYAHNSEGYAYGDEISFLTKPAAPTNVAATDGSSTSNVTVTWTKSTGATDYHVWRDAVDLGAAGDVATVDDSGADAGTITPGAATASDNTSLLHVTLSLAGESTSNGTTHTYKVVASNATGDSDDSSTNTGYRGIGSITYQWQRSAADSDASYGNIGGATIDPYNDTGAPANGDGRWYLCLLDATGAAQAESTHDRGFRTPVLLYLVIYIDGVEKDSVLLGAETIPDNSENWTFVENGSMLYLEYQRIWVFN